MWRGELCRTLYGGGVGVEAARLPLQRLSKGAHLARFDPLKLALNGGDDYELLFTTARNKLRQLPRFFRGIPLTAIGCITATRRLTLLDSDGRDRPIPNAGWDPFRRYANLNPKRKEGPNGPSFR